MSDNLSLVIFICYYEIVSKQDLPRRHFFITLQGSILVDMRKDRQYYKFCFYGFLKNLKFFEVFFILFLRDAGLSYTGIGILYSLREIGVNLMEIPGGLLADIYGKKRMLIGSFLLYILSFILFYTAHHFAVFALAFILYGIADALRSGTHKALIMTYLEQQGRSDEKTLFYGHTRACSQKGSAISALVAGAFVYMSGYYRSVFLLAVIPYVINVFLVASYPKSLRKTQQKSYPAPENIRSGWRALWKNLLRPGTGKIIYDSALHTAYLKAVKDYIQPLIVHATVLIPASMLSGARKKEAVAVGIVYTIIYLLTSYASKNSVRFERGSKQKADFWTLIAGFSLGVLTGWLYIRSIWIPALAGFAGIYIVENIRKPIMTGYISDHTPTGILTSVLSAQNLLRTLITSVIALVFGWIADRYGIGTGLFTTSLVLLLSVVAVNKSLVFKNN